MKNTNLKHSCRLVGVTAMMAGLVWLAVVSRAGASGSTNLEPAQTTATFTNPILGGDYPDPTIVKVGDDFFMTHSPFRYAPGFLIWRSRDLVHWTPVTRALTQYDGDVWAADLIHHQDKFYIYYRSSLGNHVITASRIEGPWSQPVDLKIGEIDPGHVVGPDGKRYLHMSGGKAVELAADGLSVVGKLEPVYDGWPIPADWRIECFCLEGPKLLFRDGWYHLFSAQGGTAGPPTSHMVIEARSRFPLGPWENSPYNPVIHTTNRLERWWSQGHGTIFDDGTGHWWAMYHGYDRDYHTLGRQTLIMPIEWTKDGWTRVPEGIDSAQPIPAPKLRAAPLPPLERSDDFAGQKLGLQWQFWDAYDAGRFSFQDHALVLKGKGTAPGDSSPLACIAGDDAYEVEVEVELEGDAQAGLMLFYNPAWYAGVGLTPAGMVAGQRGELAKVKDSTAVRRMVLRIVCDHNNVDFLAGPDRNSLRKVSDSINASGYNHNTLGGFLSLRPALYCAGKGQAVFRKFSYRPLP
jgi:beta-xylosidase